MSREDRYKDQIAKSLDMLLHNGFSDFRPFLFSARNALNSCMETGIQGQCQDGHKWVRPITCGRDYCPTCGVRGSATHNRRTARVIPKIQQMRSMGYFTIQFMKKDREKFRTRASLEKAGKAVVKVLKNFGFARGLRRWDWFGDPKCPRCNRPGRWNTDDLVWECKQHEVFDLADVRAEKMDWHPHLNVLVEGRYVDNLTAIQEALSLALVGEWDADLTNDGFVKTLRAGVIINYQYISEDDPDRIPKMLHRARYIQKPTFLRLDWDLEMASKLAGFRNGSWWGTWKDKPAWDLEAQPEAEALAPVIALQSGHCPHDGSRIAWEPRLFPIFELEKSGWIDYGGGAYWEVVAWERGEAA